MMIKHLLTLILSLLMFGAYAQKDTSVYYLNNSGKVVSTKDSADYFLVILPPDTSVDKKLFIVKEFYPNGKIRLITCSKTKTFPLKLQGYQITFFPNGHKMRISNYEKGEPFGDVADYYPNGKLYNIKSYNSDKTVFLKQCDDSTGKVLAENGKGQWIKFLDNDFNSYEKGEVEDGLEKGEWRGEKDSLYFVRIYQRGKIISKTTFIKKNPNSSEDAQVFRPIDVVPQFPGGLEAFGRFLQKNIRYPETAREDNRQGKVFISFVVELDGTLTDIKVAKGAGYGLDEEAIRVMKLSPRWKPGIQNSRPVRVQYSVPISFSLGNQ